MTAWTVWILLMCTALTGQGGFYTDFPVCFIYCKLQTAALCVAAQSQELQPQWELQPLPPPQHQMLQLSLRSLSSQSQCSCSTS